MCFYLKKNIYTPKITTATPASIIAISDGSKDIINLPQNQLYIIIIPYEETKIKRGRFSLEFYLNPTIKGGRLIKMQG